MNHLFGKKIRMLGLTLLFSGLLLAGCTKAPEAPEDGEMVDFQIGEQAGSNPVTLKNNTDKGIQAMKVYKVGQDSEGSNVFASGQELDSEEGVTWYLPEDAGSDLYYLEVFYSNGDNFLIRDIPLGDIQPDTVVELDRDDEVSYLVYTNRSYKTISTKKDQTDKQNDPVERPEPEDSGIIAIPID